MAKQALCEALSIDKPELLSSPTQAQQQQQQSIYASSTENIARLLESWMIHKPISGGSSRDSTQNSCNDKKWIKSPDHEEFKSLLRFNSNSNSSTTTTTTTTTTNDNNSQVSASVEVFQDESKPRFVTAAAVAEEQVPLSLLEKWLFEEGISQEHVNMLDMSLDVENAADLF